MTIFQSVWNLIVLSITLLASVAIAQMGVPLLVLLGILVLTLSFADNKLNQ